MCQKVDTLRLNQTYLSSSEVFLTGAQLKTMGSLYDMNSERPYTCTSKISLLKFSEKFIQKLKTAYKI